MNMKVEKLSEELSEEVERCTRQMLGRIEELGGRVHVLRIKEGPMKHDVVFVSTMEQGEADEFFLILSKKYGHMPFDEVLRMLEDQGLIKVLLHRIHFEDDSSSRLVA